MMLCIRGGERWRGVMFWISEERGCVMLQTELGVRSWIRVPAFSRSWRFRHAGTQFFLKHAGTQNAKK